MEVGSLVRLKSGSPNMTVTGYTMNNGATLVSLMVFVAGAYQIIQVDSRALVAVDRKHPNPALPSVPYWSWSVVSWMLICGLVALLIALSVFWGTR